jgi:hypothetical protein
MHVLPRSKFYGNLELGSTVSIHNNRRAAGTLKFNFYYLPPSA